MSLVGASTSINSTSKSPQLQWHCHTRVIRHFPYTWSYNQAQRI